MSASNLIKFIVQIIIASIIAIGVTHYWLLRSDENNSSHLQQVMPKTIVSYAQGVEKAAPAVVSIYTSRRYSLQGWDFGSRRSRGVGLGSGVIFNKDGYIVTNFHVIRNATRIEVALRDGRKAEAKVVGVDPEVDLAVLKIALKKLPVIQVQKESLREGEVVLAIGNPFGVGQTTTQGIISALGRDHLHITRYDNFIQTDAAINPGNSGGALINAQGQLVGINTAIFSKSGGFQGIGFAIPVKTVLHVVDQIVKQGYVSRGWIGISAQSVKLEEGGKFAEGVLIAGVMPKGPAAKAGLKVGDILIDVNGKAVEDSDGLARSIAELEPGATVDMKVLRGGKLKTLKIKVGRRPVPKP
ncbi:S1C family serine protease [Piscirickettsia litoralis]|uniref:2-alkenal reductase n=1 Tax=Piscirickettsia litoralis TaxID=1891921 RepID=A0ABX3A495_9GAMM|nr:trypsin-like peptidase domain-containing protein [Piscirickettsia litoralis]ODN43692.1 2-alkenal reductase [Piscirickettsia litoralis]